MKKNNLKKTRFGIVDAARGFAILLMFIYHFSFDLDYFGFIEENFNHDPFWIRLRMIIVSLFLTIVGISLYLATYQGLNKKHFRQRLLLLVFYSALVSISSWIMYPKAMIFFGILHFITVTSLLGLFFTRFGLLNLFLGISIIVIGQLLSYPVFNHPMLQWIGMMTRLPTTVDYVPIFPWFGVVLIGIYLGQLLSQLSPLSFICRWRNIHPFNKTLAFASRYSLHIYMLHQPLFLGILYIIRQLI